MAGDRLEDNLNPVGAAYYGFSTLLCTPSSLSQDVGAALGAQAGEARLREVAVAAASVPVRRSRRPRSTSSSRPARKGPAAPYSRWVGHPSTGWARAIPVKPGQKSPWCRKKRAACTLKPSSYQRSKP